MDGFSKWTMFSLYKLANGNKVVLLQQLQNWGLVPKQGEYLCPTCSAPLNLYSQGPGGWRWLCSNKVAVPDPKRKTCRTVVAFNTGTIFEKSRMSIYQILAFVHLWVWDVPLEFICNELRLTFNSAVERSAFCRKVVYEEFINHPKRLGGLGIIVEIDMSKFRNQNSVRGLWVFGGFERGTRRVFMVTVKDPTAETLVPVIKRWIKSGTTIISDCWAENFRLNEYGYKHLTVNFSLYFCDPNTGAHINHIKSSWRAAKAIVPLGSCTEDHLPGHLARFMFQKRCKQLGENRFEAFLKLAAKQYNPVNREQSYDDEDITEYELSEDEL